MSSKLLFGLLVGLFLSACSSENKLPIFGETYIDSETGETVQYKAPAFELTDQHNQVVNCSQLEGRVLVVDFFFTSCPTICQQMTNHLKLVDQAFEDGDKVGILSHTIDPKWDTSERLSKYAKSYQIDSEKWSFLTGDKDYIYELAKDYKLRAIDDSFAEERNLIHDGTFILLDGERRVRGYYDGLDKADTKRLIADMKLLLKENKP